MVDDEEGLRQKKNIAQLSALSHVLFSASRSLAAAGVTSGASFTRSDVDAPVLPTNPYSSYPGLSPHGRAAEDCPLSMCNAMCRCHQRLYCPGKEPGTPAYDDPNLDRRRSFVGVMGEALVAPRLG
jgi:hypothetical protein